jgi:hypothetical protein
MFNLFDSSNKDCGLFFAFSFARIIFAAAKKIVVNAKKKRLTPHCYVIFCVFFIIAVTRFFSVGFLRVTLPRSPYKTELLCHTESFEPRC